MWLDERGYQLSRSGMTVVVTQDRARQSALLEDLGRVMADVRSGGHGAGDAIVLRARTGEVLAPASANHWPGDAIEAGDVLEPLVAACVLETGARQSDDRFEISLASINGHHLATTLDRVEHLTPAQLMACRRDYFGIEVQLPPDGECLLSALERATSSRRGGGDIRRACERRRVS